MTRAFIKTTMQYGNGHPVAAYEIMCGKCHATETINANGWSTTPPEDVLSKKFREKGWAVGRKPKSDLCPSCRTKKRGPFTAKEVEMKPSNVVQLETKKETPMVASPIVAEPPREMAVDDRRLIFSKIDEHYLNKAYEDGWNDARVAQDLGVPRAWVSKLREENFGPEGLSADQALQVAEARKLIGQLKTEAAALDNVVREMSSRMKSIETQLNERKKVREDLMLCAGVLLDKLAKIEALK